VFGLKIPIHAPKITVLGDLAPKWGDISTEPPKAHPFVKRRHMTWRSSKSVHRCDLCVWQRDQKDEETLRYSGKRGIRPDHPRRPIEIPFSTVGDLLAVVISFKFRQHQLSAYW